MSVLGVASRSSCALILCWVVFCAGRLVLAEPVDSTWGGDQCHQPDLASCNWSDPSNWVPAGTVPNNMSGVEYAAIINSGSPFTNSPIVVSRLTLNGGTLQLVESVRTGTMVVSGGGVAGLGKLRVDGDVVLRSGAISNAADGPDGFSVGGVVTKRGFGQATLAPRARDGGYEIVVEQGKLVARNGGFGSREGDVTILSTEFARLEGNSTLVSDDVYLNNARGFKGSGALVSDGTLFTVAGDLFLGDVGAVIGLVFGNSPTEVMTISGNVHGGTLDIVGRGTVAIASAGHTYTGPTRIGVNGDGTRLTLLGGGRLPSTSGFEIGNFGILALTNELQVVEDRVSDSAPIVLRGGMIDVVGLASGSIETERMGLLRIDEGGSIVRVRRQVGSVGFDRLERQGHGTVNFARETGTGNPPDELHILFNHAPATSNGILGNWAIASSADFATYDDTLGVIGLGNRVLRPTQVNEAGPTDHVLINNPANDIALTSDRTIGTLVVTGDGGIDSNLGGHTLTLRDGGFIRSAFSTANAVIRNGRLTAGDSSAPAALHLYSELTFSSNLSDRVQVSAAIIDNTAGGPVSLVKSGGVGVTLSGINTYSGSTILQEGRLYFTAETALPANGELIVEGGEAIFDYQPTVAKHLTRLSLKQGGAIRAPKAGSEDRSDIVIDADEYLLESGRVRVSLSGDGVLRKVSEGVVELAFESPNFNGPIIVEHGTLVAGSGSVVLVPQTLGVGETTILDGGTLVHSAVQYGGGHMRLDANLHLAGGDVGLGQSISTSRWDFDGPWRVTDQSRLLLFDPRGNDEFSMPVMNLLQPVTIHDEAGLTVLGEGSVNFAGGLLVTGDASLAVNDATVRLIAIGAATEGATLHLRGSGDFRLPQTLSATANERLTIEIAAGAKASPAAEPLSIDENVSLVVNGQLTSNQMILISGGTVSGNGELSNLVNVEGELSPGNSIGVLTVGGYRQEVAGRLTAELFGGPWGVSDQLRATNADLRGTIHALLLPAHDVAFGDVFDLVVAKHLSVTDLALETEGFAGRLDVVTLLTGPDAGMRALRLTVVPEPSATMPALIAAILGAAWFSRRQRHAA